MHPLVSALLGAAGLGLKLLLIIVPLVTLFEILRYLPVFRRSRRSIDSLMRGMGLSREAAVPLFTGIFLGIAYGAGIIIRVSQEKGLSRRELFLVGLFLATCHAVVEDTLLFVVLGGNGWIMLGMRLLLASAFTVALARFWRRGRGEQPP